MFITNHILLLLFWVIYVCLHSTLASSVVKKYAKKMMGKFYKGYRILYSVAAFVLLMILAIYQNSIDALLLFTLPLILLIVASVFMCTGLFIMLASIKKYFFRLSGANEITNKKVYLVPETTGLNKYVRHPLYAGTFIFIWSAFFIFPLLGNLIACFVITVYTLIGIRFEEKKLILKFGKSYSNYQNTIPMLIPKLKPGRLSTALLHKEQSAQECDATKA